MNCEIIRDLLPLYADGLASEASRRKIEEHTAQCPDCKKLLNEMTAPMEPEPEDEEQRVMRILQAQRKKARRKTLLTWAGVLLAFVLVVWGMMEIRFSGEEIFVSSTNEEKILKEMPALALTDAEKELAQTILEIPEVRDAIESDQDSTTLNLNVVSPYFDAILPENGRFTEIFVFGHSIFISIIDGKQYTCLQYTDVDMTGHIDSVAKTLAISTLDEIGEDGNLGDVKVVYELVHAVGTSLTRCQKIKSRHMWFSFLDMP